MSEKEKQYVCENDPFLLLSQQLEGKKINNFLLIDNFKCAGSKPQLDSLYAHDKFDKVIKF